MTRDRWSKSEKEVARRAFDLAFVRECRAMAERVRAMAAGADDADALWEIHDYLAAKRKAIGTKYDYRYSVRLQVFGQLLAEGWIGEQDLSGLSEEKMGRICTLADFVRGSADESSPPPSSRT